MFRRGTHRTAQVLLVLLSALLASGCTLGGGAKEPTTASLAIQIQQSVPGGAGIQCTYQGTWKLEPVKLTGSEGKTQAFSGSANFQGVSDQIATVNGLPQYGCIHNILQSGLAPGRWRITLSDGLGVRQCDKDLSAGGFNQAKFDLLTASCQ